MYRCRRCSKKRTTRLLVRDTTQAAERPFGGLRSTTGTGLHLCARCSSPSLARSRLRSGTMIGDGPARAGAVSDGRFSTWVSTAWHELTHTSHSARSNNACLGWLSEGSRLEERRARPSWGEDVTWTFSRVARAHGAKARERNLGFF